MNVDELFNQALSEIDVESIIKDKLKASIEKSIKEHVEDQFRYNGNAYKVIGNAFKEMKLPETIDLIDYRDFMIECCTDAIADYKKPEHKKKIHEFIKNRLGDVSEKEISIDSIVEQLQENFAESEYEDDYGCYYGDGLKIEIDRNYEHDWFNIDVSEDGTKVAHLCVSTSRDGRAFHYKGEKSSNSGACVLFKSLAYHKTAVTDLENNTYTYTQEDYRESKY